MLHNRLKQLGQGMTEYIIIVALIAIAAIAVYSYFGATVKNQVAGMAMELGGQDGTAARKKATTAANKAGTASTADKAGVGGLNTYTGNNK